MKINVDNQHTIMMMINMIHQAMSNGLLIMINAIFFFLLLLLLSLFS